MVVQVHKGDFFQGPFVLPDFCLAQAGIGGRLFPGKRFGSLFEVFMF
jgi:hypothetical protein